MNNHYNTRNNSQLEDYQNYINYKCIPESNYHIDLLEFNLQQDKYNSCLDPLQNFLDFLDGEEKLNEEYCAHIENYVNGLFNSNSIDLITYNNYLFKLDFYFSKTRYDFEEINKNPISNYEDNNFIKPDNFSDRKKKETLFKHLKEQDISFYLNKKGKISIRFSTDNDFDEFTISQANMIFPNASGVNVKFTQKEMKDEIINGEWQYHICVNDLIYVQEEVFDITQFKEFFQKDGVWYRNTFVTPKLLRLNKKPCKIPKYSFYLISHLVNNDIGRFFIFINWLANFVQTLKKSQVAFLFKGQQGAGKGTVFKIIEEIFNPIYCKQINGDSLNSNYLGSFIENCLFLNFDEIAYKTIGKGSFGAFLKAIITNDEVTSEKKGINMVRATKVVSQILLFSNVDTPIEIEPSDRRFNVFTTGGNIKDTNFFGLGSFEALEKAMLNEIEDFVMYLKLYQVDKKQLNTAFDTPEKALMVNNTENNLQWMVNAILRNDWQYFQQLQGVNAVLYNIFMKQLTKYRVFQKHLILVYTALYPQDKYINSATTLIKQLEKIAPHIFGEHNLYKTNGDKYYNLLLEDIQETMPKIPKF